MHPYHLVVLKPLCLPVMLQTEPKTWNRPQPVREPCQLKPKETVGQSCIILLRYIDCDVIHAAGGFYDLDVFGNPDVWFLLSHLPVLLTALYHGLSDAAVPASAAQSSASSNAVSRTRTLKQPLTSHKALLPKPQCHGKLGGMRCQNRWLRVLKIPLKYLGFKCLFYCLFYVCSLDQKGKYICFPQSDILLKFLWLIIMVPSLNKMVFCYCS